MKPQDTITIAPSVLITIAKAAATDIGGVVRMGAVPVDVSRLLTRNTVGSGIILDIEGKSVSLDMYLVVAHGANMRDVSHEVQSAVTRSIQDLVGMKVNRVNVHIEDVDMSDGESSS
ncbi:MAG: Asp23/Gls24 family envelope stress response protein [Chloroflexi bacterium]|nr:Asp23/Gls24 family envelope stress response protein [Chloroflexota bacterium]